MRVFERLTTFIWTVFLVHALVFSVNAFMPNEDRIFIGVYRIKTGPPGKIESDRISMKVVVTREGEKSREWEQEFSDKENAAMQIACDTLFKLQEFPSISERGKTLFITPHVSNARFVIKERVTNRERSIAFFLSKDSPIEVKQQSATIISFVNKILKEQGYAAIDSP